MPFVYLECKFHEDKVLLTMVSPKLVAKMVHNWYPKNSCWTEYMNECMNTIFCSFISIFFNLLLLYPIYVTISIFTCPTLYHHRVFYYYHCHWCSLNCTYWPSMKCGALHQMLWRKMKKMKIESHHLCCQRSLSLTGDKNKQIWGWGPLVSFWQGVSPQKWETSSIRKADKKSKANLTYVKLH